MLERRVSIIVIVFVLGISDFAVADHAFAHTHIGKNPTWRPASWDNPSEGAIDLDPTDDDKLWFFSVPPNSSAATPGWPHWEQSNGMPFLVLTPVMDTGEYITKPGDPNKQLYACRFTYSKADGYGDPNGFQHLDGWHSAHGPQGAWDLESVDANIVPAWDIYIRRERVSDNLDEEDFFTLLPNDTAALDKDGDIYFLDKRWLPDKNAWGIHEHMGFYFWLDEEDEEVSVVLSAHDGGGIYRRSADFVMRFAKTVHEPVPGDLNGDGIVDFHDLEILIEHWGQSGVYRGEEHEPHEHDYDHDV